VAGSFTSEQNDLQELVELTRQGVVNTQNIGKIGAKVSCERPGRLSPDASITQTWSANGSSLYSINNYNSLTASAGVSYSRSALGTARLFIQYTDTSYPDRRGLAGSTDEYVGGYRFDRLHVSAAGPGLDGQHDCGANPAELMIEPKYEIHEIDDGRD
jgi:hypothetical protein